MKFHRTDMPHITGTARSLPLVATVFVLMAATSVNAQEWEFLPELGVGVETDDNAILSIRTDEETDLRGVLLDARLEIGYLSPTTNLVVTPRIRKSTFSDNPEFDADDQFARFNFSHQTQSSLFRLGGRYSRENIRTAERDDADFEAEDPEDIVADGNGDVEIEGRRNGWRFRPSWDYEINDFSRLITRLDYTSVDYDTTLTQGGLDNYTDSRLRLSYERDVSNRNTAILLASGRTFDTAGSSRDTTGLGISAGIARNVSQSTRLQALVGLETTDEEGVSTDPTYTVNLSLVRRLEVITLVSQYRRSISPSGKGTLMARDSVIFRLTRELSDRISAGLGVRAYRTEAIEGLSSTANERDYMQLRSIFTFNLSQAFQLEADYRYTFIRRSTLGESANANNINVWLTYRPRQSKR